MPDGMPASFGGYRVEHQMGAGTLGPVLQGRDVSRDRLVAIKAFTIGLSDSQRDRFAGGLRRLGGLGLAHPSSVLPLSSGIEQGIPYLIEEYVFGEPLDVAIRRYGPAPAADAARLLAQVAAALDAASSVGLYHGRLNPRDLLVTPELVRVTGFGVAQALDEAGVRQVVRQPYAAPERVSAGAWDQRADVFALAAIAWELLTGRSVTSFRVDLVPPSDSIVVARPDELRELLARALADDAADRFDAARDLASALEVALTGRASKVTPAAGRALESPADARAARAPRRRVREARPEPPAPPVAPPAATEQQSGSERASAPDAALASRSEDSPTIAAESVSELPAAPKSDTHPPMIPLPPAVIPLPPPVSAIEVASPEGVPSAVEIASSTPAPPEPALPFDEVEIRRSIASAGHDLSVAQVPDVAADKSLVDLPLAASPGVVTEPPPPPSLRSEAVDLALPVSPVLERASPSEVPSRQPGEPTPSRSVELPLIRQRIRRPASGSARRGPDRGP